MDSNRRDGRKGRAQLRNTLLELPSFFFLERTLSVRENDAYVICSKSCTAGILYFTLVDVPVCQKWSVSGF